MRPERARPWPSVSSTSEKSINTYAALSGESRDDGEFARCLDVPAIRTGSTTIFDRGPKGIANVDRWARKALVRLREACEQNCGVTIIPYLQHLIANRSGIRRSIEADVAEVLDVLNVPETNGALQHAARNAGLIFAGGCCGIDAGLLPWKREELLTAISSCFHDAIADLQEHQNAEARAINVLRDMLRSSSIVESTRSSSFGPGEHDGYFVRDKTTLKYVITPSALKSWFPTETDRLAVLRWLIVGGFLRSCSTQLAQAADAVRMSDFMTQPRWPNGDNPRCFAFTDPFGDRTNRKGRSASFRRDPVSK